MILLLDMGNSAVKWRYGGQSGRLSGDVLLPDIDSVPDAVWVASVSSTQRELALKEVVADRWRLQPWFAQSERSACGLFNSYPQPSRLGVDRWLAMIAAYQLLQGACCVVDAGSALTIDFVEEQGRHTGGYIIPGLALMEDALVGSTARVRPDRPVDISLSPGKSTEHAVGNGLALAQVGAIALAIEQCPAPTHLVFTGGDGRQAMERLGRGGRFVDELVLDGLQLRGSAAFGVDFPDLQLPDSEAAQL